MITSASYCRSLANLGDSSTYGDVPYYNDSLIFWLAGTGAINVTKIGIGAKGLNTKGAVDGLLLIIGY